MSARDRLLKRKPKELDIDGEKVFVRSLTVAEFLHVEPWAKDPTKNREFVAYLIARAVTDETGMPIFADENDAEIDNLPLDLVKRLTEEITELSKTGKFKSVEKNLEATL